MLSKTEREKLEAQLADLKGRAEQFHELGNETCWDEDIERLEKLLAEPKPKTKAGEKESDKSEDLNDGS